MNSIELMDMEIKSEYGAEKAVLATLDKKISPFNFSREDCEEFKIALSEACINAIEHGNREDVSLSIFVKVCLKDNILDCTVCDYGHGFREINNNNSERGWGFQLIDHFVDSWTFFQTLQSPSLFCINVKKELQKEQ